MRVIRFETAADVYAAFPQLGQFLRERPEDETPLAFMSRLAAGDNCHAALTFGAYILPRREAIGWLDDAFRQGLPSVAADPDFRLVGEWVERPNDEARNAALQRAEAREKSDPVAWALYSVGWSGGQIQSGSLPAYNATPGMTPQAVAAALAIGLGKVPPEKSRATVEAWVASCTRIAEKGLA